jgi:hypothetical protein
VQYSGAAVHSSCAQLVAYTVDFTAGSEIDRGCAGTGVQTIQSGGRGQLVN